MRYNYDSNNIFAKIIRKELPSEFIYEDEHNLAFYDIYPKYKKHILVIPKGEYVCYNHFMNEGSSEEIVSYFKAVSKISKEQDLDKSGFRVVTNDGPDSGQEVPHFHSHILGGEKLKKL